MTSQLDLFEKDSWASYREAVMRNYEDSASILSSAPKKIRRIEKQHLVLPHQSHQKLWECGKIAELYSYFDDSGEPLVFAYGYSVSGSRSPVEKGGHGEKEGRGKEDGQLRQARRAKKLVSRYVNLNNLFIMWTFTFALDFQKNIPSIRRILPLERQKERNEIERIWNGRLNKLRDFAHAQGRKFRYVKVLERHESEASSEEKRGTFHIHLATDEYYPQEEFQKIWMYGVVNVRDFRFPKGKGKAKFHNPGDYLSKYIGKDVSESKGERKAKERRYSVSLNLRKPLPIRDERYIHEYRERNRKYMQFKGEYPFELRETDESGDSFIKRVVCVYERFSFW